MRASCSLRPLAMASQSSATCDMSQGVLRHRASPQPMRRFGLFSKSLHGGANAEGAVATVGTFLPVYQSSPIWKPIHQIGSRDLRYLSTQNEQVVTKYDIPAQEELLKGIRQKIQIFVSNYRPRAVVLAIGTRLLRLHIHEVNNRWHPGPWVKPTTWQPEISQTPPHLQGSSFRRV